MAPTRTAHMAVCFQRQDEKEKQRMCSFNVTHVLIVGLPVSQVCWSRACSKDMNALGTRTSSKYSWLERGENSEREGKRKARKRTSRRLWISSVFQQVSASQRILNGQNVSALGNTEEMSSFSVFGGTPRSVCVCVCKVPGETEVVRSCLLASLIVLRK